MQTTKLFEQPGIILSTLEFRQHINISNSMRLGSSVKCLRYFLNCTLIQNIVKMKISHRVLLSIFECFSPQRNKQLKMSVFFIKEKVLPKKNWSPNVVVTAFLQRIICLVTGKP